MVRETLLYPPFRYIILPILTIPLSYFLFLKTPFFKRMGNGKRETGNNQPNTIPLQVWVCVGLYVLVFGGMSVLRYFSLHATIADLGFYEQRVWRVVLMGEFEALIDGHFTPILILPGLLYRLMPDTTSLLLFQTFMIALAAIPLYYLAFKVLEDRIWAVIIVIIYFLCSPVQYTNLFDFHPDHLFLFLIILGFYLIEKQNRKGFTLVALLSMLIKEPLLPSITLFGLYAAIRARWWREGIAIALLSLFIFFFHVYMTIPYFTGEPYGTYPHLGGVTGIISKLFLHPLILIREVLDTRKFFFLFYLFAPVLGLSLLSPLSLLPALPSFAVSLLSSSPLHYTIQNHYAASVVPFIIVSLVYGLKFVPARNKVLAAVFSSFLVFSIVFGPSPVSIEFWSGRIPFGKGAYVISARDGVLKEAIKKIPNNASVCVQNSIHSSSLAQRDKYWLFPYRMEQADYIVLDTKRTLFVGDRVDETEYNRLFRKIFFTHQVYFNQDGIYIFSKHSATK
jgi:uncharacterized membrane protein